MQRPWFILIPGRATRCLVLGMAIFAGFTPAVAAQAEFPFGRELLLDVQPMKGSKRVPSLDIAENGGAEIDLWCNTVKGQLIVAGATITILISDKTDRQCAPDRVRGDEDILAVLSEVTTWRRAGSLLILIGPRMITFRLQTN